MRRRLGLLALLWSASLGAQTGAVQLVSLTPPVGSGRSQTFDVAVAGDEVAQVGIYLTADFNGAHPANACLAYYDRGTDRMFLADDSGTNWNSSPLDNGPPVGNHQCTLSMSGSGVMPSANGLTVRFALRFLAGFNGAKTVHAYANNSGNTGNTGWKRMGEWQAIAEGAPASAAVKPAGQEAYPTAAAPDPNNAPIAELYHPESPYSVYLKAHAGATALTHREGQLLFGNPDGSRSAVLGAVTHRDPQTGAWVPNEPVLSQTNNGWRVDGTINGLLIKKSGPTQHTVTQTFTDFDSKHASTVTLTVPSLTYDNGFALHFTKDSLIWNLTADHTAAFDIVATVAKRLGPKTYTFDVSSSEPLSVNGNGHLVGDAHVILTRAAMIPNVGSPVPCSVWTYSQKDGASFTCDDSEFLDSQLPYRIDPTTQTLTDGGTYSITQWQALVRSCDANGNNCSYGWQSGGSSATVNFNTAGLMPGPGILVSDPCSYSVVTSNIAAGDSIVCGVGTYNNSGTTPVTVSISASLQACTPTYCYTRGFNDSATIDNVTLTVTWTVPVSVSISPTSVLLYPGWTQQFTANVVSGGSTAVTWSATAYCGSWYSGGLNASGLYTAPLPMIGCVSPGAVVTATSVEDPSKSASATVTTYPYIVVTVAPTSVTLQHDQSQQFSASLTNTSNPAVTWSITPAGVGTLSSSGLYTAPSNIAVATTLTVTATSVVDPRQIGTATITLPASVAVSVSPGNAGAIGGSQTAQFTANVANTSNTAVTWSISPAVGSISAGGLYAAPTLVSTAQTITVRATSVADATRSASATVTINPVAISLSPAANSIYAAQLQEVVPTVNYAANAAVTWTISPAGFGAITSTGLYTAPMPVASPTTVTLTATSVADTSKHATATLTVSPPPAGTPYQYWVTDGLTAIDTYKWSVKGNVYATPSGAWGSGSLISGVLPADGSSDYEVRMNLNSPSAGSNPIYYLYSRATPDLASFYAFQLSGYSCGSTTCAANYALLKQAAGVWTQLASWPGPWPKYIRMVVRGNQIAVSTDSSYPATFTDNALSTGSAGIGMNVAVSGTISNVQIGPLDRVAPPAPAAPASSVFSSRVDLQWPAGSDNPGGIGLAGYTISRDGSSLGTSTLPQFSDETLPPGTNTTYSITAFDFHGNVSAPTTLTVTAATRAAALADEARSGVRPTGSYWGGAGEQIDLVSGNLSFALPVIQAKARGGWGANFALSYNSQTWRQDAAGTWNTGWDAGYGFGWKLQAGAITPVWYAGLLQYCIFSDATGAEYRLDQNSGGVFTSREGVYMAYDSNTRILHFPDGGYWSMGAQSAASEPDAGTLYPTLMMDTNGNYLTIAYQAGFGALYTNTSSRIVQIFDARLGGLSYDFQYDASEHLAGIVNHVGTGESYTFVYTGPQTLTGPWGTATLGTAKLLASVQVTGGGMAPNLFTYTAGTGELTQFTTPLGGSLQWVYGDYTYSGPGRKYREVHQRTTSSIDGTLATWNVTFDAAANAHATATVSDVRAASQKVWTFNASGLATSYQEGPASGTALLHKDYTWTADAAGNVYVGAVVTTQNPGASQVQSKSAQTLDVYGNVTQSQAFGYGNLTSPARTYNYTYVTDPNYLSRYIRNRLAQVTLTAGGTNTTLVTNTYDGSGYCGSVANLTARTRLLYHDDTNYGASFVYRGNVTNSVSLGGSLCTAYETTGVAVAWMDGAGHSYTTAPSAATNYSLPGVLTPGGNANLATSIAYAGSWAVTSVAGPNGATGTTTYDGLGRPTQTTIPDGAVTNYTYAYAGMNGATANQQTATLGSGAGARFKRTTLDGFGRVTRVETGHDATTVSQVDTQYAPCACSALGKLWRTSQPYAPGGTPVWTTNAYDASGRTLTVTAPDGSVTRYSYSGNQTTVTDAAGKWKTSVSDAFGNLVQVIEPNPAGGANLVTNYTYNSLNQLVQVSMPRSNGTQTRTFGYSGTDMVSATNPENGTVTYTYDGSHHVTQRTDNIGQQTRYSYDVYGRLTQVQHWAGSPLAEQINQRWNYYYDANPYDGTYSQNTWGRLAAVDFAPLYTGGAATFTYQYSYNQAGRVTNQRMTTPVNKAPTIQAAYTWDTEGRMTALGYPAMPLLGLSSPTYGYQFDTMGRLGSMQDISNGTGNAPTVASATYGVANEMQSLTWGALAGACSSTSTTESRNYNNLYQLTRITTQTTDATCTAVTTTTLMDMQYLYTAGQNNGRIAQSIDGVVGETVNYTYDALNRLASAGATNGSWGQGFTYDGFGNLTGKTATAGSAPTLSVAYDPATNHQVGVQYDGNGNNLWPGGVPGATYDVENRMVVENLSGFRMFYTYDPKGKRVNKLNTYDGSQEMYFYGIGGQKLLTVACTVNPDGTLTCTTKTNVYFGGKLIRSGGALNLANNGFLVATDRLGSVRANSNGERFAYYPYGEERTSTADGREKFGTYFRDATTQDYADQRYYGVGTGRFNTADPYMVNNGLPGDVANPGSWNRYAYVQGDPANFTDQRGLMQESPDDPGSSSYCDDNPTDPACLGLPRRPGRSKTDSSGVIQDKAAARKRALSGLKAAKSLAADALGNPDCAAEFGTKSGMTATQVLAGTADGIKWNIDFTYNASPDSSVATTRPAISLGNLSGLTSFVTKINDALTAYGYWNAGDNVQNADTILHELGHVLRFLGFTGGDFVQNDGDDTVNQKNSADILNKCLKDVKPQ